MSHQVWKMKYRTVWMEEQILGPKSIYVSKLNLSIYTPISTKVNENKCIKNTNILSVVNTWQWLLFTINNIGSK